MQLELNGRIISTQPDQSFIEQTILKMTEDNTILTLQGNDRAFIQAVGSRSRGFIMTGQDNKGIRQLDQLDLIGPAEVILAFTAFFSGSDAWKQRPIQRQPAPKRKPGQMSTGAIFVIILGLLVVVLGMAGFGMFMTARSGGGVNSAEISQFLPIILGLIFYFGWLIFLFSWFRPRLAGFLARTLNTNVNENIVSGSWQTGGALWKRAMVTIIEIFVFIPGALLPLLAIGIMFIR